MESGILGFGIRNPTKDWNPESKLPKDLLQIGLSYSLERKAIYGKPPQGIWLNVTTYSVISAYLVRRVKTIVHEFLMKGQGHGQRGDPCL